MDVKVVHGQPTQEMWEKYIFEKWAGVFEQLGKGPSEPYPAYHEVEEIASDVDVKAIGPR